MYCCIFLFHVGNVFFFLSIRWLNGTRESVAATASSGDNGGHKWKWNNGFQISTQNKVQTTTIVEKKHTHTQYSLPTKAELRKKRRRCAWKMSCFSCLCVCMGEKNWDEKSYRCDSLKNVLMHFVRPRFCCNSFVQKKNQCVHVHRLYNLPVGIFFAELLFAFRCWCWHLFVCLFVCLLCCILLIIMIFPCWYLQMTITQRAQSQSHSHPHSHPHTYASYQCSFICNNTAKDFPYD